MPDIDIENAEGKPVRFNLRTAVIVQLIISGGMFGAMYTTTRRDIQEQSKQIQELQMRKAESSLFEREALQRLVRIEVTLDDLKDKQRGRR